MTREERIAEVQAILEEKLKTATPKDKARIEGFNDSTKAWVHYRSGREAQNAAQELGEGAVSAEGFVVYHGTQFEDSAGNKSASFLYLSRKGGGGIDKVKSVSGEREWLPMLTEKVETFWTRRDATEVASVWGGLVSERARLERAENKAKGASDWIRLEPGDEGRGL